MKRTPGGNGDPFGRVTLNPFPNLCAITDIGRIRDNNEDTFFVSPDGCLLMVADGVGGAAAGEVASRLAVDTTVEYLTVEKLQELESGNTWVMEDAFAVAHRAVRAAGLQHEDLSGMATTLNMAYITPYQLYVCHVGDVRCYVSNLVGIRQLTQDHTAVWQLVLRGEITPEEARQHPRKNLILQAIGLPRDLSPSASTNEISHGDLILLCSDGLWDGLSDEGIQETLVRNMSITEKAEDLVSQAINAGGRDNITLVLYQHLPDVGFSGH